jgi:hypothetical protein
MPAPAAKLSLLRRVILAEAAWDEQSAAWARVIPHDFPGDYAAHLLEMVRSGEARLVQIRTEESGPVGFIVYSIEVVHACPPELVVVAASGRDGRDLTAELDHAIHALAEQHHCRTVRFHTMRPGLIHKAGSLGYRISEVILRKEILPHVQEK